MTRHALVGLIYDKALNSPTAAYDDAEAASLISTDMDELDQVPEMLHEIWAQIVEVMIGVVMLAKEVGWIWPIPLLLVFGLFWSHTHRRPLCQADK